MKKKRVIAILLAIVTILNSSNIGILASDDVILDEQAVLDEIGIDTLLSETEEDAQVSENGLTVDSVSVVQEEEKSREQEDGEEDRRIQWMWFLDEDGCLVLTGGGEIAPEEQPWSQQAELIKEVTVDKEITGIGVGLFEGCINLEKISFLGDAPVLEKDCFEGLEIVGEYPAGNSTWNEEVFQDCGGKVEWVAADVGTIETEAAETEAAETEETEAAETEVAETEAAETEAAETEAAETEAAETEVTEIEMVQDEDIPVLLEEADGEAAYVLKASDIWYHYPEEGEVFPEVAAEVNCYSLESLDLFDVERIGLTLSVKLPEDMLYEAGDVIEITASNQVLTLEDTAEKEAVVLTKHVSDGTVDDEAGTEEGQQAEVFYSVQGDGITIRFGSDVPTADSVVYLEGIELAFFVNKAELSYSGPTEYHFYINGSNQEAMTIQLPVYPVPSGISQTYTLEKNENEKEANLLKWKIVVGSETDNCDLTGYSVESSAVGPDLTLLSLTDVQGNELAFEQLEKGFRFDIPEGNDTPFEYEVVYRLPEKIESAAEILNKVQLLNEEVEPCADAQWSSEQIVILDIQEEMLSWEEFYAREIVKYNLAAMSDEEAKQLYASLRNQYVQYRTAFWQAQGVPVLYADGEMSMGAGTFSNDYLEVAISETGQFTIGTTQGDPDYDTDDNKKLLYGHPSPNTSETLIKVNGDEYFFTADQVYRSGNKAVAVMAINDHGISITQELSFIKSGNTSYDDAVKISYTVQNTGSSSAEVGIRIMLDTMLASNDAAPFRIPNVGNVTTNRTFTGDAIPYFYQVYDNLESPTTLATGYLITENNRKPDKVQFTNWGGIRGSSWSHSPTENGTLGDSAVGIYFDPVTITSGSSTSVCTSYGVGLGVKGNAEGESCLDENHVEIKVVDAVSEEALEGATITTSAGSSYQTGEDGTVILPLSAADNQTLSVSMTDYNDGSLTYDMEGGRQYTVKLKKTGETTPVIESVLCGTKNILTDSVSFAEDVSGVLDKEENSSKISTTKIQVQSDTADCVYYLYKENEQMKRNTTGVFEFKTMPGNNGDKDYISDFSAGSRYYVRCVAPDGKEDKEQILIRIYNPSLSIHSDLLERIEEESFNILPGSLSDLQNNLFVNILAGPGENKFKIGDQKGKAIEAGFVVKFDVNEQTLKIGINAEQGFLDNSTATNEYKNYADKVYRGNKKDSKKLEEAIKRWRKSGKSQYRVGKFSTSIDYMGYGEFKLTEENAFAGTIYVTVTGGYDASYSFNFPPTVIPIPTYITLGSDGQVEIKMVGPVNFDDSDGLVDAIYELLDELSFYIGVSFEFGAGNSVAAKVGGKVKGGVNIGYNFKSTYYNVNLKAKGSIEAKALIWTWSYPVAEATWTIHDGYLNEGNTARSVAPLLLSDIITDENAQMQSREYATLSETDSETEGNVVMSNVYTSATPTLVSAGGHQYRFWLQDISSREAQNRTALVYSVDGGDMVVVEDDGTADFSYSIFADGTNLYVAWMDCNQMFGSEVTLSDTEKSLDISLAKIDTTGSTQTQIYQISQDSVLDQLPSVFASGNTVYVAWNSMESGFFDDISGNRMKYRVLTDTELSDITEIMLDDKAVANIQIQMLNDVPTAVYTSIIWDEALAQSSQETHYISLASGTVSETNITGTESVPQSAKLNNEDMMFWYGNENIYYTPFGSSADEAVAVFAEEELPAGLTGNFTVVSSGEKTYLIWVDGTNVGSDTAISRKAMISVYEDGAWGKAYQVADLGTGTIENLTGTVNEEGQVSLFWQCTEYDEEGNLTASNLMQTVISDYTDLVLQDITYANEGAAQGEDYTFTLNLLNNGNTSIETVSVQVDDTEITLSNLGLEPGCTMEKEVVYSVPYTGEYTYSVTVTADGDVDATNNEGSFTIGHSMLRIVRHDSVLQDGEEMMLLEVVNDAGFDTENVTLRVFADSQAGVLLYQGKIDVVGEGSSVYVAVPVSIFSNCDCGYAYLLVDGENETESDLLPTELYYDTYSVRILDSYDFAVTAGEGGSITGTYEATYAAESQIALSAEAADGYVFWQWTSDNGGAFENAIEAVTSFTMPDGAVNLTAEFRAIAAAETLSIPSETLEMQVGETSQIVPVATPEETSEHFFFSSSDENVVAVNEEGKVVARSAGTAVVTVTCGTLIKECSVTVTDIAIQGIDLITPVYINGIGSVEKMGAELTPANATEDISWSSSDETVATVEQDGTVTAVGCGTVTITAASVDNPEIKAECTVYVMAELEAIHISSSAVNIHRGDSTELNLTFQPAGIIDMPEAEWEVYNSSIVTVTPSGEKNESAVVTAVGIGTTIIEVSVGDISTMCTVTVDAPAQSISLQETELEIKKGRTAALNLIMDPSDSTSSVTWSSDDTSIVSVDSDGTITARGEGTAIISVDTDNGLHAECTVTVIPAITYASTIEELQSPHAYDNNMDEAWVYTVAGAEALDVTFSEDTYTENSYDYIKIYDQDENLIGSYCGDALANQTVFVTGETVKIVLTSDGSVTRYGFRVVSVEKAHVYENEWTIDKEPTCGETGIRSHHCIRDDSRKDIETIPATENHSWNSWKTTATATVFKGTIQKRTCKVCGKEETREVAGTKLKPTIQLNATSIPLKVNQSTTKIKVTGLAAGDSIASWKSSDPTIAKVDKNGKITAQKKIGKAIITVTLASKKTATIQVKVQKKAVKTTKISGLSKKLTVERNKKVTLNPVVTPITSLQKLTYSSSKKKVATVSSKGVITAKASGTAKITVKSGSKKFVITVTVPKVATKLIKNVPTEKEVKKGKSFLLNPQLFPANSEDKITYKTSNKKIATVNNKGKVTGKMAGSAMITVKAGKITVKCKVTVK